jgi:hypothetical protein
VGADEMLRTSGLVRRQTLNQGGARVRFAKVPEVDRIPVLHLEIPRIFVEKKAACWAQTPIVKKEIK